ncbi:MAG: hypothetical protein O7G85_13705 [Planctomycetota bacterium]|nr:hypothetical protein [Planctomycetota bacterium]
MALSGNVPHGGEFIKSEPGTAFNDRIIILMQANELQYFCGERRIDDNCFNVTSIGYTPRYDDVYPGSQH